MMINDGIKIFIWKIFRLFNLFLLIKINTYLHFTAQPVKYLIILMLIKQNQFFQLQYLLIFKKILHVHQLHIIQMQYQQFNSSFRVVNSYIYSLHTVLSAAYFLFLTHHEVSIFIYCPYTVTVLLGAEQGFCGQGHRPPAAGHTLCCGRGEG